MRLVRSSSRAISKHVSRFQLSFRKRSYASRIHLYTLERDVIKTHQVFPGKRVVADSPCSSFSRLVVLSCSSSPFTVSQRVSGGIGRYTRFRTVTCVTIAVHDNHYDETERRTEMSHNRTGTNTLRNAVRTRLLHTVP